MWKKGDMYQSPLTFVLIGSAILSLSLYYLSLSLSLSLGDRQEERSDDSGYLDVCCCVAVL